jgi:hypothetical protein
MSAIATVLVAMGHTVTGSDLKESPGLSRLRGLGVQVSVGHRGENVGQADVVTVSTAVPPTNPEVVWAVEHGIPVLRRAEVLGAIAATRRTVAVAGTHGKTTTSSMLALALAEAGLRPSFVIGGEVNEIGSGAVWAGRLAAILFSLLQTLCLWRVNPRSWLTAYLTACAEAGGEAPGAVESFLPWNVSEEQLRAWSLPGEEEAADSS